MPNIYFMLTVLPFKNVKKILITNGFSTKTIFSCNHPKLNEIIHFWYKRISKNFEKIF